jgi:hypothetical protein
MQRQVEPPRAAHRRQGDRRCADAITPWLTTNQFLDKLDTNLQKAMAS